MPRRPSRTSSAPRRLRFPRRWSTPSPRSRQHAILRVTRYGMPHGDERHAADISASRVVIGGDWPMAAGPRSAPAAALVRARRPARIAPVRGAPPRQNRHLTTGRAATTARPTPFARAVSVPSNGQLRQGVHDHHGFGVHGLRLPARTRADQCERHPDNAADMVNGSGAGAWRRDMLSLVPCPPPERPREFSARTYCSLPSIVVKRAG